MVSLSWDLLITPCSFSGPEWTQWNIKTHKQTKIHSFDTTACLEKTKREMRPTLRWTLGKELQMLTDYFLLCILRTQVFVKEEHTEARETEMYTLMLTQTRTHAAFCKVCYHTNGDKWLWSPVERSRNRKWCQKRLMNVDNVCGSVNK